MARSRRAYRCQECGSSSLRWSGRCPACSAWNSLVEEVPTPARGAPPWGPGGAVTGAGAGGLAMEAAVLAEVDAHASRPRPTGVGELDRVLGGGLVPGSVTLVGGEPGIGKSTLLLQALARLAAGGSRALLVSAEESPQQVKRRADRLGAGGTGDGLWVVGETSLAGIRSAVEQVQPHVLVVDSIQTVWDPEFDSAPGSVSQVRGCAQALVHQAKTTGLTTVVVGHVTKDGALAGPRVLEHVVDTVLTFEGDRHHALRLLRAVKHRFGATGELGVFEMTDAGLVGVDDASGMFLGDRRPDTPGSVVFPAVEGQRPLLVEVQALVMGSNLVMPRRSASGVDSARLSLLIAVLRQRAGVSLQDREVYASAAGGARVAEPAADLALCLALASAASDRPVPEAMVAIGEVGLGGELRQVSQMPRRLAEAERMGFSLALVPAAGARPGAGPGQPAGAGGGLRLLPAGTLAQGIALALGK